MSSLDGLSQAWVAAEESLPVGWRLTGLLALSGSDEWVAMAAGPQVNQSAEVWGPNPAEALNRLADKLRKIQGSATG